MKKIFCGFTTVLFLVAAISSCQKKKEPSLSGGGKGGNAVLNLMPQAHGTFVDSCTVYIKYGTLDNPADGVFDDSMVCVLHDTIPVATFTNLTNGNYYVLGKGYHVGYFPPQVKGGLPVRITQQNEYNLYLQLGAY